MCGRSGADAEACMTCSVILQDRIYGLHPFCKEKMNLRHEEEIALGWAAQAQRQPTVNSTYTVRK